MRVGSEATRLVVLRGNSGSGKTTVAQEVRLRRGRGVALVSQDNVRRTIMREKDVPGGANIGLIDVVARYALDHGYHVILEGILDSGRYGAMLRGLCDDHAGRSHLYYLDVPFEETLRRHATRPQAGEFTAEQMRDWYRPLDLLPWAGEQIIGPAGSPADTVEQVLRRI